MLIFILYYQQVIMETEVHNSNLNRRNELVKDIDTKTNYY